MKPSTRALIASLLFGIASVALSVQGEDAQSIAAALTAAILVSTSWICESIEKGSKS